MKQWAKDTWRSFKRGTLGFVGWIKAAFCALMDPEGRRAWAVIIAWGCGAVMTVYVEQALYLVRNNPMLVFWLGVAAMSIILVVISAITGLLVKRDIGGTIGKGGATFGFKDHDDDGDGPKPLPLVTAERVAEAAGAAATAEAARVASEVAPASSSPQVTPPKV